MTEPLFRDPAADEIRAMQEKALAKLMEGFEPDLEEGVRPTFVSPHRALYTKLKFDWRHEDRQAIAQLKTAAERVFFELFGDSVEILDTFYESVRVVESTAANGRRTFKKDERGRHVEDWEQLDGMAVEKAVFDLQRVKLVTSQQLSDLFLEAVFAKHVSSDKWNEAYEGVMDGTVRDREASANREYREDKYFAFFRFWIWYKADAFQKELNNVTRLLERVIEWRIRRRT